ncbi:MAG: NADH-quinone oxidoreductase subunit N [Bacteriovoracaceae bacterium]|nr:NADH-quinone oxidoreductase subunit N [Bacteriovoracaceae bacterium]
MEINNYFPLTSLSALELNSLIPLMVMAFGAIFSLLVGTDKNRGHDWAFAMSFGTLVLTLLHSVFNFANHDVTLLGGTLVFNSFTKSISIMAYLFALIAVVLTYGQDRKEGLLSEIYALILFSCSGMVLMLSTTHLLFMFIALEIMSLAIYVMVAMRRTSQYSAEAGMKYFILGGLASALMLYGSGLIFGSTGSFELTSIAHHLTSNTNISPLYFVGLALLMVSLLFKVGAAPFHGWVADVYQGAPTNVTGYMGAAVKFTAFLAFARISQSTIFVKNVEGLVWFQHFIWIVAAVSMIYGNFVAIAQTELKRMLAFSTIAHTGYLLLGLYTMGIGTQSLETMLLYLFFYALSNLGAFAVISLFENQNQKDLTLDQIAGQGIKHPVLGISLTIFLFSMAGIPLTSGFIGKYGLFSAAVAAGEIPLVVIAVLTSVVSVYYYLRVLVYLFMKEADGKPATFHKLKGASITALVSALMTLQFGLFPKMMIQFVKMITQ